LISATWEVEIGGSRSKAYPRQKVQAPISKVTKIKRAGDITQVVEQLPSKHKALSSNPSTGKNKQIKKKKKEILATQHETLS
jgi:hypothetical protein